MLNSLGRMMMMKLPMRLLAVTRTALAAGALVGMAMVAPASADSPPAYQFSQDFMARAIPVWTEMLAPYRGKPGLRYLEVGVFEGRSFVWMMDNILTSPSARAWALDLFNGPFYKTFQKNLEAGNHSARTTILAGDSRTVLPTLPADSFDIIYIDGNHEGQYVLSDAVMAWQLLKDGGLLIFDDYRLDLRVTPGFAAHHLPQLAVDAFVSLYAEDIEVVHDGYQKALRKRIARCDPIGCSAFGQYSYQWYTKHLTTGPAKQVVELSGAEREVLEEFLRSRLPGEVRFSPSSEFLDSKAWKSLLERLEIEDLDRQIVTAEEVRTHRARKPDDSY